MTERALKSCSLACSASRSHVQHESQHHWERVGRYFSFWRTWPDAAETMLYLSTSLCLCFTLALPTTRVVFWAGWVYVIACLFQWGLLLFSRYIYIFHVFFVQILVSCNVMFVLKLWKWLCTLNALAVKVEGDRINWAPEVTSLDSSLLLCSGVSRSIPDMPAVTAFTQCFCIHN